MTLLCRSTCPPSFANNYDWVAWWVEQVATPTWWPILASVLGQKDICQLAWLVWASFQMPMACYCGTKGENNYTAPPAPQCLNWDAYLAFRDMKFSGPDYRICQIQETFAYAKALQHWAEKA